jgi:hypothetical protein
VGSRAAPRTVPAFADIGAADPPHQHRQPSNQGSPPGAFFCDQHQPVTQCRLIPRIHSRPTIPGNGGSPAPQPRLPVQPNTPASGASAAGAGGIDDWLVPGQPPNQAGNPGIAPASAAADGYPDDWIHPNGWNPLPTRSPSPARPPTNPVSSPVGLGFSNGLPPTDPFAAYWSTIPASRLTAVAFAPPIFPDASGRFQLTLPAPAPSHFPFSVEGGLLGGIPKMLAEQAAAGAPSNDAGYDLLGAIPRMPAATAPLWSAIAGQGFLDGTATPPGVNADVDNDPSGIADLLRPLPVASRGLISPGPQFSSPPSFIPPGSGAQESDSDEPLTAGSAVYYPNIIDQIVPCLSGSAGCVGGSSNRGGGGGGGEVAAPRPALPSPSRGSPSAPKPGPSAAPRAIAPSEQPSPPADPSATEPIEAPNIERTKPVEPEARKPTAAPVSDGENGKETQPLEWQQYEQKKVASRRY